MTEAVPHSARTKRLLLETLGVQLVLVGLSLASWGQWWWWLAVVALGAWHQRLFFAAHEAVHAKLIPGRRGLNDFVGQLLWLPLALPLRVYRKIHAFHHGHNRRGERTSALDTFVVRRRAGGRSPWWPWPVWYWLVFGGGWFVHGIVSVVAFLTLPLRVARRISPAFEGWRARDRRHSVVALLAGVGLHVGVGWLAGVEVWLATMGAPIVVFALIYSALVYVFHYRTGYGSAVREHVRSLRVAPVVDWWLLSFQEHATHHADTSRPWYELAGGERERVGVDDRLTLAQAVLWQLRGPTVRFGKGP